MNPKMDLDISNYTIEELFLVLEVNEFDSSNLILAKTDQYIRRFTEEENILLIDFFQKVKIRLKEYFENGEQEDDENGDEEPSVYINDEERESYLKDKLLRFFPLILLYYSVLNEFDIDSSSLELF